MDCETLAAKIEERELDLAHAALFAAPAPRTLWPALAATLLGVAIGSSWLTYLATRTTVPAEQMATAAAQVMDRSMPVAKITATRNCLWSGAVQDVGFGSTLFAGQQLNLAAGLVEVTFIDGAVVLKGHEV
jgi:hypothetical protein